MVVSALSWVGSGPDCMRWVRSTFTSSSILDFKFFDAGEIDAGDLMDAAVFGDGRF